MKKIIYLLIIFLPYYTFTQHNKWIYNGSASLNNIAGKEINKYKITGTCYSLEFSRWIYKSYNNVNDSQAVSGYNIACNYDIQSTEYNFDAYGNMKITVTAHNIPANATVKFTTTYNASTAIDINGFNPGDLFPPSTQGVAQEYLQPSTKIQSNDATIKSKAEELTANCALMTEAVDTIAKWVDGNIAYRDDGNSQDAVYVFTHPLSGAGGVGSGNCEGFTNLMIAMLRSVVIPSRFTGGRKIKAPYTMPTKYGTLPLGTKEALHATYEVYYPTLGWISGDAQSNLHFNTQDFISFYICPDPSDYDPISALFTGSHGSSFESLAEDIQTTTGNTENNYVYKDFSDFGGTVTEQQNMVAAYVGDEIIQSNDTWDSPDAYGSVQISGGATITVTSQVSARNFKVLDNSILIIDGGQLNLDPGFTFSVENGCKLIIRNNGVLSIDGGSIDIKKGAIFEFYNGGGILK